MPKGTPARLETMEEIKIRYDLIRKDGKGKIESYKLVAEEMGLDWKTVATTIQRFSPKTQLATDYLKAQAMRLAVRVVREANVSQALDVLSRPNIGVLAPLAQNNGNGGGFFLSVSAESCGSVKVGVMQAPQTEPMKELQSAEFDDNEPHTTPEVVEQPTYDVEKLRAKQELWRTRPLFGRGTQKFRESRAEILAQESREKLARKRKEISVGGFTPDDEGE